MMKNMLFSMLFSGIALGASSQPEDVTFVATHDRTEQRYVIILPEGFVPDQPHDLLIVLHVMINGKNIPPAQASAAGVWFYADSENGSQLLLTGHPSVPGSWRLTASLNDGDSMRMSFAPNAVFKTNIQFHVDSLSGSALQCQVETNALVIKAASGAGAARLCGFSCRNVPVSFMPERRPFSRAPVACSPDPHQVIAGALVEWDWRMQDGIQTPREPRTWGQAIEKLLRGTEALVSERAAQKNLRPDEQGAWENIRNTCLDATKMDDTPRQESLWLKLHQLRRSIVLANPLFKTSPLLLVKHVPSVMSHQLTQVYGYCARPGGGLFVLQEPGVTMRTRNITPENLPAGNFMTPELSYDAQ
ncbi:MAG: hypothetical protein NTW21_02645 [Verrucomicrobia bacterium]|nr:hypothetical protein [Verrucomicrobiota bacterium]